MSARPDRLIPLRDYDDPSVSLEERIGRTIAGLVRIIDAPSFPGRMQIIDSDVHQLSRLWQAYMQPEPTGRQEPTL